MICTKSTNIKSPYRWDCMESRMQHYSLSVYLAVYIDFNNRVTHRRTSETNQIIWMTSISINNRCRSWRIIMSLIITKPTADQYCSLDPCTVFIHWTARARDWHSVYTLPRIIRSTGCGHIYVPTSQLRNPSSMERWWPSIKRYRMRSKNESCSDRVVDIIEWSRWVLSVRWISPKTTIYERICFNVRACMWPNID